MTHGRVMFNKYRRRQLRVLDRRLDYLEAKARHDSSGGSAGWYRAELEALKWARSIIEAAITIGSIEELARVAALEPDPEAWARRGEIVDP